MEIRDGRATVTGVEVDLGSQELGRREPFKGGTLDPAEVVRMLQAVVAVRIPQRDRMPA